MPPTHAGAERKEHKKDPLAQLQNLDSLTCPITKRLYSSADETTRAILVVETNRVYSQSAVKDWFFVQRKIIDPLTNLPLTRVPRQTFEEELKSKKLFCLMPTLTDAADECKRLHQLVKQKESKIALSEEQKNGLQALNDAIPTEEEKSESWCHYITRGMTSCCTGLRISALAIATTILLVETLVHSMKEKNTQTAEETSRTLENCRNNLRAERDLIQNSRGADLHRPTPCRQQEREEQYSAEGDRFFTCRARLATLHRDGDADRQQTLRTFGL